MEMIHCLVVNGVNWQVLQTAALQVSTCFVVNLWSEMSFKLNTNTPTRQRADWPPGGVLPVPLLISVTVQVSHQKLMVFALVTLTSGGAKTNNNRSQPIETNVEIIKNLSF